MQKLVVVRQYQIKLLTLKNRERAGRESSGKMNYNSIDREAKEIHQRFPITRTTPTSIAQNQSEHRL